MQFSTITRTRSPFKESLARVLSVVGGIVVLAAVAWVGMQGFRALPNAQTILANAFVSVQSFFSPAEQIVMSVVDSQVVVDEEFSLTWEHRGKENDGSYAFFYECSDDVHLARTNDGSIDTIFCNTELPIFSDDTTLTLIPRGEITGAIDLLAEIRFRENGETVVSERGTIAITVQDEYFDNATSTSATPINSGSGNVTPVAGPATTQVIPISGSPVSDPNGHVNLAIRFIAYGIVDRDTGVFEVRGQIPQDLPSRKRGAIKFVVENLGTKESGRWEFQAKLPTSPSHTYKSDKQQTLFPGDKIEFIIGFDRVRNATSDDYEIEVDHDNDIAESNEQDNTIDGIVLIDRS